MADRNLTATPDNQFWMQDNRPELIYGHRTSFCRKLNYIHENPVRAGIVYRSSRIIYTAAQGQ
jgi:hypothetical protein